MTHDDLRKTVLIEASKIDGVRLFPNPVGMATAGKVVKHFTQDGKSYALIENPRPVKFGLAQGTSDLIGYKTEKIGSVIIPRFLCVEIKVGEDNLKPEQRNWIDVVTGCGGIAGVVRDTADGLKTLIDTPLRKLY